MPANAFDLHAVERELAGSCFAGRVHHVAATPSTNTLGLAGAQAGMPCGVWVAEEQTAGRGRGGHAWHSAVGDGLYVSVLLRPRLAGIDALKLSLAAGLAAREAVLGVCGIAADIRWPNDLMIAGVDGISRKFGGILTETAMDGGDGTLSHAVIGIGMNLNHAAMPEELADVATSLRRVTGRSVGREAVLVGLLRALVREVEAVVREAGEQKQIPALRYEMTTREDAGAIGQGSLAERFEQASTWVRGVRVHVAEDDGYTGVTDGLDPHGLLRVRLDDATARTVRHGGVRKA